MKSSFLVVALMAVMGMCAGGDIVIDSFDDTGWYSTGGTEYDVRLRDPASPPIIPLNTRDSQGYPTDPDGPVSGVVGGRRDVQVIMHNAATSFHELTVDAAPGTSSYAAGVQVVGDAIWKYGTQCDAYTEYDDEATLLNPNPIPQGLALDANMGGGGGRFLQLNIINDHDAHMDLTLETNTETTPVTFTATFDVAANFNGVYTIPLNSGTFPGITGANLTDVDGIRLRIYPAHPETGSLDFTIDQIYTNIPEPATMTLLGLGGLGMLIRRRRKKS